MLNSRNAQKLYDLTSEQIEKVQNSYAYQIATSPGIGRTMGVYALAGASAPGMILGATSLAIGAGMDTMLVNTTRSVKHEHSKLVQYINAKTKQDYIMDDIAPQLKNDLSNVIVQHDREGKKSLTDKYKVNGVNWSKATSWGKTIIENGQDIIDSAQECAQKANVTNAALFSYNLYGMYDTKKEHFEISAFNNQMKALINGLREHPQAPGYDNIQELDTKTREQTIQTQAIIELAQREDFMSSSPEQLASNFLEIKSNLEKSTKEVKNSQSITGKARYLVENFISANNITPSKYKDVPELINNRKMKSQLSKIRTSKTNAYLQSKQSSKRRLRSARYLDLSTSSISPPQTPNVKIANKRQERTR